MIIFKLFFEFFKAGLFAVGGGLATLPFLFEISDKTGWFSTQDIMNLIAISESTPGPLGVNMATYAGVSTLGLFGGVIATLGLIFPSIVIIEIVATILEKFKESKVVKAIFTGLRPASTGLITAAGLLVAKVALLNIDAFEATGNIVDAVRVVPVILAIVIFIAMKKIKKHPIVYIVIAALAGIILGI